MGDLANAPSGGTAYFVNSVNTTGVYLQIKERESRDSLVAPLTALTYQRLNADEGQLYVNSFGTFVMIQEVERNATPSDATRLFRDADDVWESKYAHAIQAVNRFTPTTVDDFDFSFAWWAGSGSDLSVTWDLVQSDTSLVERQLLCEAVLLYQLGDLVAKAISDLPDLRRKGRVDPLLSAYTQDLFAAAEPRDFLTSAKEISAMGRYYEAWSLKARAESLKDRFDQVTSSYTFYWEHAERKRDKVVNTLLAGVALVGLIQADKQLSEVLSIPVEVIDWVLVGLAALVATVAVVQLAIVGRVRRWREARSSKKIAAKL